MQVAASAQTDKVLDDYLATHRYSFTWRQDSSLAVTDSLGAMLLTRMDGKSLFVYGEGWSHGLHLNNLVISALTELFENHGLKEFFTESARSWVAEDDYFLAHPALSAAAFYSAEAAFYQRSFERKRMLYSKGHYQYLAIDFERPHSLSRVLHLLVKDLPAENRGKINQLAPYIHDTTWLQLSPKKFIAFYEQQRDNFYKDSLAFKQALDNSYAAFRYLMIDPHPFEYHDNRNAMMADHILAQLLPPSNGDMYFLDCGMAHARPGKKDGLQKSTVHLLAESDRLKNKIVVTNLYCDSCIPIGDNWALDFMKQKILASFKTAANAPITVFDLSDLPGDYKYIAEDYGQLLVYATHAE